MVHTLSRFEIPASLSRNASRITVLPSTKEEFQDLGGAWLQRQERALLLVPSVILPAEQNVLINPFHPDFGRLVCHQEAKEFAFDPRLYWTPVIYVVAERQFFVSRREPLPDGRRFTPVASALDVISLMRAYRKQPDPRDPASSELWL